MPEVLRNFALVRAPQELFQHLKRKVLRFGIAVPFVPLFVPFVILKGPDFQNYGRIHQDAESDL